MHDHRRNHHADLGRLRHHQGPNADQGLQTLLGLRIVPRTEKRLPGGPDPNRIDEILLFNKELLDLDTDSVYIFPMRQADFDRVRIVGQGFDRKLVADEVFTQIREFFASIFAAKDVNRVRSKSY
jgi:hypothetical protein